MVVDVELSAELNVAFPVAAPIDITVAAPKALMFVAVALKTLKVADPVVTLVVKSGDVPNTSAPEPVSSLITPSNSAEVVAANTFNLFPFVVSVPAFGTVTFDAVVVVKVRLFPPDVISDEPFAKVNVAEVAGAVIVTLFTLVAVATPISGVTSDGVFAKTNAPLPVSSEIKFLSCKDVVAAKILRSFPEVINVPAVGKVTLLFAVVVRVKEFAPEVISDEPFANVSVALVAGVVNVSLLYVVADTFPFAKITPETDEDDPVEVYKLPPIPTPPVTFNAPVVVDVETVESEIVSEELKVLAPASV